MSRVHVRASAGLIAFAALVSAACSAPVTCRSDAESPNARTASSERLSGSTLLSNAGDAESFALDVLLASLPTLWPSSSAIKSADVSVAVTLAYTAPPVGGDGFTQMPRVQVRLGRDTENTTGSFLNGSENTAHQLFDDCSFGEEYCCAFGSEQCQARLQVALQRLDGAPFPPVQVSWTAGAGATIDSCPQDLGAPSLTLTSETP